MTVYRWTNLCQVKHGLPSIIYDRFTYFDYLAVNGYLKIQTAPATLSSWYKVSQPVLSLNPNRSRLIVASRIDSTGQIIANVHLFVTEDDDRFDQDDYCAMLMAKLLTNATTTHPFSRQKEKPCRFQTFTYRRSFRAQPKESWSTQRVYLLCPSWISFSVGLMLLAEKSSCTMAHVTIYFIIFYFNMCLCPQSLKHQDRIPTLIGKYPIKGGCDGKNCKT